jgi:gliding motility-associated-like protein
LFRKYTALILWVLAAGQTLAQDFSNKGKDFWVGYGNHVRMFNGGTPEQMQIYLTSDVNTSGNVSIASIGFSQNFTVTANQISVVTIPRTAALLDEGLYNHGIHITALQPVVAYGFIYVNAISGATVYLPTNTLGKNYYSLNYTQISNEQNSYSYFFVCATDTGTTSVEITPTRQTKGGFPAGVTQTITLNQGQIYQVLASSDLTGSTIKSVANGGVGCKKIAVFCGSGKISIGCSNGAGSSDNLYQQMYPASAWGKKYILVPSINTGGIPGTSNGNLNYFRIFRPDPSSNVFVNGVLLDPVSFLNDFYEFSSNVPYVVESDKPVLVAQYFTTRQSNNQQCGGNADPHDPDMIYLNPVEQTVSNVTLNSMQPTTGTVINRHFINVVLRNSGTGVSSFRIDGAIPATTPTAIALDNNFAFMRFQVSAGAHNLSCDSGFNAIAYGFGNAESYGYSAGTNLRDLYNFIAPLNPLNISGQNTACACTPFFFTITYPFQPTSLLWDFKGFQSPNVTINNPVADSTYLINGRQVWRYKLASPYTYCPAGNYPLSITAGTPGTDGCGNSQIKEDTLYVKNTPTPSFSYSSSGCIADSVYFTDNTVYETGTYSYRWTWDFGDGNTSTLRNPAHKYQVPGTYTVKFSFITNIGCISTTTPVQVSVNPIPQAKFGVLNPVCEKNEVIFSDSSTVAAPGTIFKWIYDYGDGTVDTLTRINNIRHIYNTWGPKTVTLTVVSPGGCSSAPVQKSFNVNPLPQAAFTPPVQVCLPYQSASFTDASSIADNSQAGFLYKWKFGEPSSGPRDSSALQNPTHLYSGTGPFTISLVVRSAAGCKDTATNVFSNIFPQPLASFAVTPENCLNAATQLNSTAQASSGSIANWFWDFNDGSPTGTGKNPSKTYATSDTFNIRHWIKTAVGCQSDTAIQQVIVNPLPTAGFKTDLPACATRNMVFTDTSKANAGNIVKWTWNFGNGRPDSVINFATPFNYAYNAPGNYPVGLTVETNKGCKNNTPLVRNVTINPLPVAGYISPEVCLSDASAVFADTSSVSGGTIVSWSWNFGDQNSTPANNVSNLQNPQHRYSAIGSYTATLTVTTNSGCVSTTPQTFTVNGDIPVARVFNVAPGFCSYDSVAIRDSSTVNFGNVTKVIITWDDLGTPAVTELDNNPFNGKIYRHRYPVFQSPLSKTYQVRYQAYSGTSCSDDVTIPVTVYAIPKVQYTAIPDICKDANPYTIVQAAEIGGVPGAGRFSGTGVNAAGLFTPTFLAPNAYPIKYLFISNQGCRDSATQSIRVLTPPVPKFGVSSPLCTEQPITFSDSSVSTAGSIIQWIWDFGDATVPVVNNSNASVSHAYASPGLYEVVLKVQTSNGCKVTARPFALDVNPNPVANFSYPANICMPVAKVDFTDLSTISDGTQNAFTYSWNFGDAGSGSNTSFAKNPSHTYPGVGPYDVKLLVTSGRGCKDDTTLQVNRIRPEPKADFTSDSLSLCANQQVRFIDRSDGAGAPITLWDWNFGDGGSFSPGGVPPPYVYANPGTYQVSLKITNQFGCTNQSVPRPFVVYPYPQVFAGTDTVVLEGGEITINATASGDDLRYTWTPPTFLSSASILRPLVRGLSDDITYTLQVSARGGCKKTDQVFIRLLKSPVVPNTFTPNGDGINDTWLIQYLESYPNCRIQVFNRSGQLVYETKSYTSPGWDGTMNGKPLPFGTYYYVLEPGSGRKPLTGYVTIIK